MSKTQHLALKRAGNINKTIPSMCVSVFKNDKDDKPLCAKSCILILVNFEDRIYQKHQRYVHVLKYTPLLLLTAKSVGDKRILQQGDRKNAFYNAQLPDDEVTVICPPIGDPYLQEDEYWIFKKNLYGLRQSPHNWHNTIKGILLKMGLNTSPHYPCLISVTLVNSSFSTCTPQLQS